MNKVADALQFLLDHSTGPAFVQEALQTTLNQLRKALANGEQKTADDLTDKAKALAKDLKYDTNPL